MTTPATAREIVEAWDEDRDCPDGHVICGQDCLAKRIQRALDAAVRAEHQRCNAEHQPEAWQAGYADGVRAERERCALYVEQHVTSYSEMTSSEHGGFYSVGSGRVLAAALRAPEASP